MPYIVGVDIGGTFTDAFAANEQGVVRSAKAPSTPPDFARGFLAAIEELASQLDISTTQLLEETAYVCHGTTTSLNALVTGNTAKVGFITTMGHRDSIYIMNLEGRYAGLSPEEIQNVVMTRKPQPLVPKTRVHEVTERIDYKGSIVVPLNERDTRSAITSLINEGVDAIAVSLLWSFINPVHEQRIRELIHEIDPRMYVALSSEISPRIREFARNATTIMSTQVGPTLQNYLEPLFLELKRRGLQGPLLIMQGTGGSVTAQEAPRAAIMTIGSVLTGGVVGALHLASSLGHKNVISTDVGGTTFLVGLIVDGEPVSTSSTILNQHIINVPMVNVHSIGSGGGAIAWLDEGRNLRVGPNSAGASPGPAAYGQGGTEPTNTDANLVLGILDERFFLGGRKVISLERARSALRERIAEPLGITVEQAAAAVFAVQNSQTADLVRKVVVESGHDPRDFALYAFGGGGPLHCFAYAAELGVSDIVVPLGHTASAFSAYGLAASDVMVTAELSDPANFPVPAERVAANFTRLEEQVLAQLQTQGIEFTTVSVRREIDIRYSMQMAEVTTPVANGSVDDSALTAIIAAFEERYAQLYGAGTGFREAGFQLITYRVHATGTLPFKPELPRMMAVEGVSVEQARKGRRPVFLDVRLGYEETNIYDYSRLTTGHHIEGPAIIEAPTTTVVIPREAQGTVDAFGNVRITYNEGV